MADGAATRPTGGASGARGPVAGPPGVSRGIGRTGLAASPMVWRAARASAETVWGAPGVAGNDGRTGDRAPAGRLGAGREGSAGLGGAATPAAGLAVLAGSAACGGLAPVGAGRCNGGLSTCTGGRNGVPLPAPITIEGREPEVGSVFSGSGPRGLTCGVIESVVSERAASSGADSPAAGSCSSACERRRALTCSAVSTSIELE